MYPSTGKCQGHWGSHPSFGSAPGYPRASLLGAGGCGPALRGGSMRPLKGFQGDDASKPNDTPPANPRTLTNNPNQTTRYGAAICPFKAPTHTPRKAHLPLSSRIRARSLARKERGTGDI